MKVYIVEGGKYPGDGWIVGVFSSKSGAVACLEARGAVRPPLRDGNLSDWWQDKDGSYDVSEYDLQS